MLNLIQAVAVRVNEFGILININITGMSRIGDDPLMPIREGGLKRQGL